MRTGITLVLINSAENALPVLPNVPPRDNDIVRLVSKSVPSCNHFVPKHITRKVWSWFTSLTEKTFGESARSTSCARECNYLRYVHYMYLIVRNTLSGLLDY